MDVRRELARVTALDRPWQLLVNRRALAGAVEAGVAVAPAPAGPPLGLHAAIAIVDGRRPASSSAAVLAGTAWHDLLRFLAVATEPTRPAVVDEGLVRALHWLLHRHLPDGGAKGLRAGADLRLPLPPPGGDAIDAAVWAAAALRRADPCRSGSTSVAHAVEVLLLSQAEGLAPWYAGRPSPTGEPREVLQAAATAHLDRCREGEQRWFTVARHLAGAGLPDRMAGPCWDAAAGLALANDSYRSAAAVVRRRPVSEQQASRDLRALVDTGLLEAAGRTRDRTYRWARRDGPALWGAG